jgi:hypothetical protein
MLASDIFVYLLKFVSLRELSILQSLYWPLRSQVKLELLKRAKEGLQYGAAIYFTIPTTVDILGSLYRSHNFGSMPTLNLPFRYVAPMGNGLMLGNGTEMLKLGKWDYDRYGSWDDAWGVPRPPADIQKLYFTFPDTISYDEYSFVCVYNRDESKPVFPPISPEGIQHLCLNQLNLADVYCIETWEIEWMLKTDNTWTQDRKWELEFPLQRLTELDCYFHIVDFAKDWGGCCVCGKWDYFEGFDYAHYITVIPKTLDDEQKEERSFKSDQRIVQKYVLPRIPIYHIWRPGTVNTGKSLPSIRQGPRSAATSSEGLMTIPTSKNCWRRLAQFV